MKAKGNFLVLIYFVLFLVHMVAIVGEHEAILLATKPIFMVLLIIYLFWNQIGKSSLFGWLLIFGFLFSLGGDVALMLQDLEGYREYPMFLIGLGSFLVTHVLYFIAFLCYPSVERGYLVHRPMAVLPFILIYGIIMYYLWDHLGEMRIPVAIYSAVICIMAIGALNLSEKMKPLAFWFIFLGVIFFMFSDTVIAFSKFREDIQIPFPRLLIMFFYLLGQFNIARGAIAAIEDIPAKREELQQESMELQQS